MRSQPTRKIYRTVTLRRHPIVLMPHLVAGAALSGALMAVSQHLEDHLLAIVGLLLIAGVICYQISAWRILTITVRYDRISVRRLAWGTVQNTVYTLSSLRDATYCQSLFGKLFDTGTLTLSLPEQTLCYTLLTPYSAINDALGW